MKEFGFMTVNQTNLLFKKKKKRLVLAETKKNLKNQEKIKKENVEQSLNFSNDCSLSFHR